MARHLGVAPGIVRILILSVARSEPDLELVDLVPFSFGPLPLGYREKLLQALAGGNRLLRIHDAIISHRGFSYVWVCACALSWAFDFLPGLAGGT
jgi:hypothetical protein